ncbi:MAG: PVC-type heme-binding CxxCH protein [Verrucomicrobiia bacterium]|jgi:putative membrane-bound dehydrogenase-like protein
MKKSLSLSIFLAAFSAGAAQVDGPLSPKQSLKHFKFEDGSRLRLEIAAAEPLIVDPVATVFDEAGRMFVAENRGYPTGPGEGKAPAGVVALLEDTDGNGVFDKRTNFAEGLSYPNGLLPWRGGIFVTCAPDIFYLKDTDGDGKADLRKVVLTGFHIKSTTQLRVSHPKLGLDGWIWVTAGLQGGDVESPANKKQGKVSYAKSDGRFHPDTFEFATVSGQAQFGLTFDDYGNKFICANRNPVWHTVLQPHHLKRNPHYAFSQTVQVVGTAGAESLVYPLSRDTTTAGYHPTLLTKLHLGSFTSACGTLIFRGGALGADYYGNAFICEPAQNLVQRRILTSTGGSFDARVARDGQDFLATPDTWSRIVYADFGPDGALYLTDFYRKTLDHPRYLPEGIRDTADFVSGNTQGRIYRVAPSGKAQRAKWQSHSLAGANVNQLVAALDNAEGWRRETARRLLLEGRNAAAVAPLKRVAANGESEAGSVAALWLLDNFGKLDDPTLTAALKDKRPRVREAAVRLIEPRLKKNPKLADALVAMNAESDSKVRFQQALALGEVDRPDKLKVLAGVAMGNPTDLWTRAAVLSSIGPDSANFAINVLRLKMRTNTSKSSDLSPLMSDIGRILGSSQSPKVIQEIFTPASAMKGPNDAGWQRSLLAGIADGLRAKRSSLRAMLNDPASDGKMKSEVDAIMRRAVADTSDPKAPSANRLTSIELLAHSDFATAGSALLNLVGSRAPVNLQQAAIRALTRIVDPSIGPALVDPVKWRVYPPSVSRAVVTAMRSNTRLLPDLLSAMESGVVQNWMIEPRVRASLMKHRDKKIQALAKKVFGALESGDRMKAYEESKAIAKMKGDNANGKAVYGRVCAQCHVYEGLGFKVGPDLTGVRNQPAEALLMHIVMPNYEVVPGFTSYEVETKDDRSLNGLLASESDTSVTLRLAQGVDETILRSNIQSMRSTSLSLMPDELEKTMPKQELADLLAFLKGL